MESYMPCTLRRLRNTEAIMAEAYFGCRSLCSELGEST